MPNSVNTGAVGFFSTTVRYCWMAAAVSFRASHPLLTEVQIGAQPTGAGEWSARVPLVIGLQSVAIEMHAGVLSRTFQVQIERGAVSPAQALYAKSSNGLAGDRFGARIAINGDEVIASAPGYDDGRVDAGAAYVFGRSQAGWEERGFVRASDLLAGDDLCCVAVSGERMVIGAPGRGAGRGAAYVFRRGNSGWQEEQILTAVVSDANDRFGAAVAIDGTRIIVGAPGEDSAARTVDGDATNNSAADAGAAYVFTFDGTTWARSGYLKAQNADPGDRFGTAVAVHGADVHWRIEGKTLDTALKAKDWKAVGAVPNTTRNITMLTKLAAKLELTVSETATDVEVRDQIRLKLEKPTLG